MLRRIPLLNRYQKMAHDCPPIMGICTDTLKLDEFINTVVVEDPYFFLGTHKEMDMEEEEEEAEEEQEAADGEGNRFSRKYQNENEQRESECSETEDDGEALIYEYGDDHNNNNESEVDELCAEFDAVMAYDTDEEGNHHKYKRRWKKEREFLFQ